MRQIDFSKQKERLSTGKRSGCKLWTLMLLAVLLSASNSFGQVLTWQPPAVDELYRNGFDEGKALEVYALAGNAVTGAKIVITLPKGIKTNDPAVVATTGSNTVSYQNGTHTPDGENTIITIPITDGLKQNDVVHFRLPVWAVKEAAVKESSFDQIKVKVIDGANAIVDNVEQAIDIKVKNPIVTASFGSITGSDYVSGVTHSLTITSSGGKAKGITLKLTADDTFTLSAFELDGTDITSKAASSGNVYTISLPDEVFDMATSRTLTFKAIHPLMGGNRTIKASATTVYGEAVTISDKVYVVPAEGGTPVMERTGLEFVKNTNDELCYGTGAYPLLDGSLCYAKVTYTNTGSGDAAYFQSQTYGYNGLFYFKRDESVYYKIGIGGVKNVETKDIKYDVVFSTSGVFSSDKSNWYRYVYAGVDDLIKKGEEIVFYIPVHYGKIFLTNDASIKEDMYTATRDFMIIGIQSIPFAVKNRLGENGGVTKNTDANYRQAPRFYEKAQALTFNDLIPNNSTAEIRQQASFDINMGYVGAGSPFTSTLRIETPLWITIESVSLSGSTFSLTSTGVTGEYTITRTSGIGSGRASLACIYTVDQNNKPAGNTDDVIRYLTDVTLTQGSEVTTVKNLSRVTQPVYYRSQFEALAIESLSLERVSQGYKPTVDSELADIADGTLAPDQNKINHTVYMDGDNGVLVWRVKLTAAIAGNASQAVYLPLFTEDFGLSVSSGGLYFETPTVSVGGGAASSLNLQYTSKGSLEGYLRYAITTDITVNTVLEFRQPFIVKGARNAFRTITTQALTGDAGKDPLTEAGDLQGKSIESLSIGTYSLDPTLENESGSLLFTAATIEQSSRIDAYVFYSDFLRSPYFKNEVRHLAYLSELKIKVPKGYSLSTLGIYKYGRWATSNDQKNLLENATIDRSNENYDIYTTKVADMFGDGSDKWLYPDDKWVQRIFYTLKASPQAKTGSSTIFFEGNYADPKTGKSIWPFSYGRSLSYTGYSSSLISADPVLIDNKASASVEIGFTNASQLDINANWLLVEGSFSGLSASSSTGMPLTVKEGKYIQVSDLIATGKTENVTLSFNYTGNSGEKIKVTSLSGWDMAGFDPATASDLLPHTSGSREITLNLLENKVDGSLNVSKTIFAENDTYTLTAAVNSAASPGSIMNPVMEIIVPTGQIVQSASVEYKGTTYPLSDLSVFDAVPGGFIFDVRKVLSDPSADVIFPGYESGGTGNTATLTVTYQIGGTTPLTGISFTGKASATGANIGSIEKNGIAGKDMYPSLSLPYDFKLSMTPDRTSFSYLTLDRTLTVEVELNKLESGTSIKSTDRLELVLPDYLAVVDESSLKPSWDQSGVPTVSSSSANGETTVVLPIASSAYTTVGNKVTYTIPVRYTGTADKDNPRKDLKAKVITLGGFSGNPTQDVAAGNTSSEVLFVIAKDENPALKLFADQATKGELEILSSGVTGKFQTGSTWSAESGTHEVQPLSTNGFDDTYPNIGTASGAAALQQVEAMYGNQSYGIVELGYTVYPSLNYTYTAPSLPQCGSYTLSWSALGLSKTSTQFTKVVLYRDASCTDIVLADKTTTELPLIPGSYTYYIRSENLGGNSRAATFTIVVNALAVITDDLDNGQTWYITPTASPAVTKEFRITATGDGLTYQWYKNGVKITGATNSSYTPLESGTYYVDVIGCNTVQSESVVVVAETVPSKVQFSASEKIYYDNNAAADKLWDMIDSKDSELTYWYSTTPGGPYNTEVTATAPVLANGTYYVVAKNKSGVESTPEASLKVEFRTPVLITSVKDVVNNREAGTTTGTWYYDDQETIILTVTAAGTPTPGESALSYELYKDGALAASSSDGTLSVPSATSAANGTYIVKVTGASGTVESVSFDIVVCPSIDVSGLSLVENYCESDADLKAGIPLTDLFTSVSGLEYYYNTDGGSSYTDEVTNSILLPKSSNFPSGITYYIVAKNAKGTYSSTAATIKVIVEKPTAISGISGYDVTEGEAVNILVSADGEGTLDYVWEKYENGSWQLVTGASGNAHQLTPSAQMSENGDHYRVTVTGMGSAAGCNAASREFSLNVKSATIPPLGNNKVTWEVIGYGKVSVTADGLSIMNGSHVNDGAKLLITGTTWKSNVLESITINGSKYTTSPASYTANDGDVHIVVVFNGTDPNPDPSSNAEIENGSRIWTEGGNVCIYTETATRARIVTFNGRLVTDQKVGEGESRIQLPDGYYIVTLSDGTTKKIAIRNF